MDELRLTRMEDLAAFDVRLFKDKRLPEMLFRYRARNYPSSLDQAERGVWDEYRRRLFEGADNPESRLAEIASLRAAGEQAKCLDELEKYLLVLKTSLE